MKTLVKLIAIVFTVSLLLTGNAFATDASSYGDSKTRMKQHQGMKKGAHGMQSRMNNKRMSELMGMEVKSRDGKAIGTVSDIVVNDRGQANYLIISYGGILGLGEDLVPIPWQAVNISRKSGDLMVNVDPDVLEKAPNFADNEWPDFNQTEWQRDVRGYYGMETEEEGDFGDLQKGDLDHVDLDQENPGTQEPEFDK